MSDDNEIFSSQTRQTRTALSLVATTLIVVATIPIALIDGNITFLGQFLIPEEAFKTLNFLSVFYFLTSFCIAAYYDWNAGYQTFLARKFSNYDFDTSEARTEIVRLIKDAGSVLKNTKGQEENHEALERQRGRLNALFDKLKDETEKATIWSKRISWMKILVVECVFPFIYGLIAIGIYIWDNCIFDIHFFAA